MGSVTGLYTIFSISVTKVLVSRQNTPTDQRKMSIQQEKRTQDSENRSNSGPKMIDWNKLTKLPTVGIIGGGQLAQMLYQSAISLGIDAHLFASATDEAAPKYFRDITRASSESWTPPEIYHFAQKCDVVTFDHELVSPNIVRELEKRGCLMLPTAATLELSANKANQRQRLSQLGHALPPFQICNTVAEITSFGDRFGWPIVVKPSTGGYDGRGVFPVFDEAETTTVFNNLNAHLPFVVEPQLELEAEGSVIAVRSTAGECVTYPMVKTVQHEGMCREVTSPGDFPAAITEEAQRIAENLANDLDVVGALAVEFFILDGKLMVNELAPRPHNTGHITIEANVTSQFENHLRAVLGLPLGSTALRVPAAATVNLIANSNSQNIAPHVPNALEIKGTSLHLYSKSARKGRKIGHVTATADSVEEALNRARQTVDRLSGLEAFEE
ncbi:MAG: 5-(carboxyamino)imidazole ribonucleotide synthase [Actinomycetota bacterium]|nr:MAG: 5-(carboxyamino)imidazole ribonucleotide synthase [Actinomycetota bacterium]